MPILLERLARHWWALALRGALALIFGLLAFFWPTITLTALVLLFGAYALLDGAFAVAASVAAFRWGVQRWLVLLVDGLLSVAVAIAAFAWPQITALALVYLMAFWAILTGALVIAAAVRLRRLIKGEWLLGLSGVASVGLGLLLALFPGAGLIAWAWMLGAFACAWGVLLLALAWKFRGFLRTMDAGQTQRWSAV